MRQKILINHKNRYRCIYFCLFLLVGSILFSCSKMTDNYQPFIKDGALIYTGKVDSLAANPGKNRIQLVWLLVSDPKITKCKVFWNNGSDSLLVPVKKTAGTDTVRVILNNLAEGLYSFNVYTYDDAGHSSVKATVTGTVYGDNFANSIFNRAIDTADYHTPTKHVRIKWFGIAQQAAQLDVNYTDNNNQLKTVNITKVKFDPARPAAFLDKDSLPNYKQGTSFTYRTGYLPTTTAIDTFFTAYKQVTPTLYVPPPPPSSIINLALKKTVTASSSATPFLTDGDRDGTNKWQPSSGDRAKLSVWFYVDLGSLQDFTTTQVYFTKDPAKITYYEVLYTVEPTVTTSTVWKRAFIKFGAPDPEDINVFDKVNGRYVKVNIGLLDSGTNINVSELEVYNK